MLREEDLPDDPYELLKLYDHYVDLLAKITYEESLYQFVKAAWPIIEPGSPFIDNWHIKTICGYIEAFHYDRLPDKRLIISISPASAKSLIASVLYPAWAWATKPDERIMTVSNSSDLSTRDARRMKQVVTSEWYQRYWPITLSNDQNEKTLFTNDKSGSRQAIGITSSVSGKRCSILAIDDPIDTKHAFSDVINQTVLDTYDQALSTRLNDFEKSGILLIMQRTRHDDLTGHLLKKVKSKWTHLSIPMRYEGFPAFDAGKDIGKPELNDPRTQKGELMFPQRASEKVVQSLEEDLGEYGTSSQLQQRPSPLSGGILKQQWWRIWPDDKPFPTMTHIFHSWDTAFDANDLKTNAASACTRWGIFWSEERDRWLIMCLGVWYGWVGFDELRRKLKELDDKHKPDANLIERKATGISLYNDLRKASPGRIRGYIPREDKVSRAHSVSPMLQAGLCYVPNRKWALGDHDKKIIGFVEYLARFPTAPSPSSDLCDTSTQALIYMRSGNWAGEHPDDVELPFDNTIRRTDEQEEDIIVERKRAIYG